MKATALSGTLALLLVAAPSFAKHHVKKHEPPAAKALRAPVIPSTAMHTAHVHQRDVSVTIGAPVTPPPAKGEGKKATPQRPCLHDPITIARGTEEDHFSLTRCDGSPTPEGVDHLSALARPDSVQKWTGHGPLPTGMKRLDARLAERLQLVADHFGHPGHPVSLHIISGLRPNSVGSFHATAQAIDFRVDDVRNEELVTFCKTLPDTGCGYYPNSSFVHLDVRAPGTGHVSWIDASGPGEAPHYVTAWPVPPEPMKEDFAHKLERILPPLPVDDHPADVRGQIDAEASNARRVH
jgi:hypothetical protein